MTPDDRARDRITRRPEARDDDDVETVLDAEEEAAAEASQRPGPRGRMGGVPYGEDAPREPRGRPGG